MALVTLGSVACTQPPSGDDAGPGDSTDAPDTGVATDSGLPDAGRDAGFDAGDGGPDSGCDADATCGITTPPSAGDPGWFCALDSQCKPELGGFCQTRFHRCTRPCGSIADCPVSWTCAPVTAGGPDVCQCPVQPPVTDVCNNVDDNCDGVVDNGDQLCALAEVCTNGTCDCPPANLCGSKCVDKTTDPFNCGACGHACDEGFVCSGGGCTCPMTGSNVICPASVDGGRADGGTGFVCVDSMVDPRYCGACANHCSRADDCVAGSCQPSTHEWARWSLKAASGYTPGSAMTPDGGTVVTVVDAVTGLEWQRDVEHLSFSWTDAATYCASVGEGWRLPTRIELLSLIDYARSGPALDPTAFPQSSSQWLSTLFWSASPKAGSTTHAWGVDFSNGYTNTQSRSNTYPVRCVR